MTKRNLLLLLVQAGGLAEMMLCNAAEAAELGNTTQLLICLHLFDAIEDHTRHATASELAIRMRTSADRVRKQANALLASGHIRRLTDDDRLRGDFHDLRKRPYVLTQQGSCAAARGLRAAKEIDATFAALMPTRLAAGLVTFDAWVDAPLRRAMLDTPDSLRNALDSGRLITKRRGFRPASGLRESEWPRDVRS